MQQTGSHRQNYRLWEQQEVLQERRRLRSEELFPRVMAASVCLKDSAKDHTQFSDTAAPDHQQHFNFQALPKALQLQVAGLLSVSSRCALGQCSRTTLELVCTQSADTCAAVKSMLCAGTDLCGTCS